MKRKMTAILLALALCAAPAGTAQTAAATATAALTARPTASAVLVNGKSVAFDAYNISDNNYFKLRDLAFILSGTEKQFEVSYDEVTRAIALTSGVAYTPVGGEMTGKGAGDKTPAPTSSKIYLDGKDVSFTAYNIDGNNYFKLRDIGAAFNFGVDWDGARNTIVIDTGKGYTPEKVEYITIKGERYSTSLTELNLSRMDLTDTDIEPLKYMTSLTELNLDDNQISDIGPLSGLTNLTVLWLDGNQISNAGPLSGLTNLTELWFNDNQISDIGPLSGLINLTVLWLDGNQISDVSPLSGLTNLMGLGLDDNQISDISPLSGLTALEKIELVSNKISDISPLSGLTNLTTLWLRNNQIIDVSPLSGLTNLERCYLYGNPLTDAQIAELRAALPDCDMDD
jgi:Leucine-rich repeat (LRR) protein